LALVSSPAFDPNSFVLGLSDSAWKDLNADPGKPLISRFSQTYPPGSAFKPVTAAIGLKSNKLNPDEKVAISGLNWQPDSSWGIYTVTRVTDPGGPVNLLDAFIYSDNIYFAKSALRIGRDTFLTEAKNFGIGEDIPFEYPLKNSQLTANASFKSDVQLADTGYGQAEVMLNPLQLAMIFTGVVNNGDILRPVVDRKNLGEKPQVWKEKAFSPDIAGILLKDLSQVVQNPNGTGFKPTVALPMAGKTGTAELKKSRDDASAEENGWFVAFNTDNPRLLIGMMIEDVKNKGGSHYVVPRVKQAMVDYLFRIAKD